MQVCRRRVSKLFMDRTTEFGKEVLSVEREIRSGVTTMSRWCRRSTPRAVQRAPLDSVHFYLVDREVGFQETFRPTYITARQVTSLETDKIGLMSSRCDCDFTLCFDLWSGFLQVFALFI